MWAIWTSRNNIVHDKGASDHVQSMRMTRDALALLEIPRQHARILPGHRWRPPEVDVIKTNTDADIASDAMKGGACGVARSYAGFIGAWCKPYPGITDLMIAEALSLRDCEASRFFASGNGNRLLGGGQPLGLSARFLAQ